jgi:hypothetical protein
MGPWPGWLTLVIQSGNSKHTSHHDCCLSSC